MKLPMQLTLRDIPHSEAVEAAVREKAAKLDLFYPRIMRGQVVVERAGKHQGKHFGVRIDLSVPGREIVVRREHGEDVYAVLRDAFDVAKRQLEDFAQKQRGEVKHHAEVVATGIDPG